MRLPTSANLSRRLVEFRLSSGEISSNSRKASPRCPCRPACSVLCRCHDNRDACVDCDLSGFSLDEVSSIGCVDCGFGDNVPVGAAQTELSDYILMNFMMILRGSGVIVILYAELASGSKTDLHVRSRQGNLCVLIRFRDVVDSAAVRKALRNESRKSVLMTSVDS